ncbi:hypothetical protein [Spirillospora sp. CA-294931]|uniref:hypothetical protein n=1 Tax=Spirillospora sp. CA-294931 TaxID=3240042 RepID=UPI003D8C59C3
MSGSHRSGSHRAARDRGTRRGPAFVVGAVAIGAAVCVLAAFAILTGLGMGDDPEGEGRVVGHDAPATDNTPLAKSDRTIVPDACELLSRQVADKLAPGADRTQADNYQSSDRQNQCVWGAYTGDRKRQLTVELRAVAAAAGQSAAGTASRTFQTERAADESGKALVSGQELTEKTRLSGVGEEGYAVYSLDEGQSSGEAVANVRVTNVLVTVHYSGGDKDTPLAATAAMDGAVEAAKSVIEALNVG